MPVFDESSDQYHTESCSSANTCPLLRLLSDPDRLYLWPAESNTSNVETASDVIYSGAIPPFLWAEIINNKGHLRSTATISACSMVADMAPQRGHLFRGWLDQLTATARVEGEMRILVHDRPPDFDTIAENEAEAEKATSQT